MRYFFHIAYLGTNYRGFQKHSNTNTVQQVLEDKLRQVLKTDVPVIGCGRTDAGVHASQFYFHADVFTKLPPEMIFWLNKALPPDIAVYDIIPVNAHAHARFDAYSRTYQYHIHTQKNPFLNPISAFYPLKEVQFDHVKEALHLLLKYTDYRAFCTTPGKYQHTICNVTEADLWVDNNLSNIKITISANRFLSKMIRIITGKLLKIGAGKISVDEFEYHLAEGVTPAILDLAYPQGLHLTKVKYPYLDLEAHNIL